MTKVAINGLGRIGRAALKIILDTAQLELVAVNDIVPAENIAYLLKYDSTQGRFKGTATSEKSSSSVAEDDTLARLAPMFDGAGHGVWFAGEFDRSPWRQHSPLRVTSPSPSPSSVSSASAVACSLNAPSERPYKRRHE